MKILTAALIFLIVVAAVFFGLSYYFVRLARETTPTLQTTSTATIGRQIEPLPKINQPPPTTDLYGPTNTPHMIGPSGPPPNY